MSDKFHDGVVISNGRCSVTLLPAGSPHEIGFPTRIEVVAGPFQGAVLDETVGRCDQFHRELVKLYETLSGTATLGSYQHFELVLAGGGAGGISVDVVIYGNHVPNIKLEFEFDLDQSYLPEII